MVYRIDNRKKKHNGRYTALGIVFGIIFVLGSVYVYENYNQPIMDSAQVIKNKVDLEVEKAKPVMDKVIQPLDNSIQPVSPSTIQIKKSEIINVNNLEYQIHDEINKVRTQNGLKPLDFNEQVSVIAREHSQDMAINNYFDHTSLEGKTLQTRIFDARIPCYPVGENIEENYLSVPDLLNSIMQTWMQSSGHRENILSPYYTSEGVGVYASGDNLLITDDFC